MLTTTQSVSLQTMRAKQAIKILRQYCDQIVEPYWRAKLEAIPDRSKGGSYFAVGYPAKAMKLRDAITAVEAEIEAIK